MVHLQPAQRLAITLFVIGVFGQGTTGFAQTLQYAPQWHYQGEHPDAARAKLLESRMQAQALAAFEKEKQREFHRSQALQQREQYRVKSAEIREASLQSLHLRLSRFVAEDGRFQPWPEEFSRQNRDLLAQLDRAWMCCCDCNRVLTSSDRDRIWARTRELRKALADGLRGGTVGVMEYREILSRLEAIQLCIQQPDPRAYIPKYLAKSE